MQARRGAFEMGRPLCHMDIWGFSKIRGTFLEVPTIRTTYSILGSILGSPPILGNYHLY